MKKTILTAAIVTFAAFSSTEVEAFSCNSIDENIHKICVNDYAQGKLGKFTPSYVGCQAFRATTVALCKGFVTAYGGNTKMLPYCKKP